ncbi:MAG: hypothetical protein VKQ33_11910 [Candidatus Sericytochromatia bacterium]|nr:hypothetical protein [Candidatus Sericytochromatia bacterium]
MKIQLVTHTRTPDGALERRPPVTVLETSAARAEATAALTAVVARLGAIVAIPPAAHEANLRLLLARDLEAHGLPLGAATDGEPLTLTVLRTREADSTAGAEVHTLRYEVG